MIPTTPKGRAQRARLLATATRLFAEQGYERTTMRGIAKAAGVSPGLAYRYFEGKEELVAELYDQLATAFVERAQLGPGSWTQRGLEALDASLEVLAPHRDTLAVLMGPGRTDARLSPPLARTAPDVQAVFVEAVAKARNPPADSATVGEMLYVAHLAVLLFWVIDRSEGQEATTRLRAWIGSMLPPLAMALRLPGAMTPARTLLSIVRQGLGLG